MARVFLVDDDPETLKMEETFLKMTNRITSFSSGLEMLDALQKEKPDVILLDLEMPGMDGLSVLRRLKGTGIPVIAVTGKNDRVTILKCLSLGAEGYILKPPVRKDLNDTVNKVLEKYREKRAQKKILLVDDDQQTLMVYKTYLESLYEVTALHSATAAMEYLEMHKPDLILLDYYMPIRNGKSVYTHLKKTPGLEHIPTLILTGEKDTSIIVRDIGIPASLVIQKGEKKDILMEKVRRIMNRDVNAVMQQVEMERIRQYGF